MEAMAAAEQAIEQATATTSRASAATASQTAATTAATAPATTATATQTAAPAQPTQVALTPPSTSSPPLPQGAAQAIHRSDDAQHGHMDPLQEALQLQHHSQTPPEDGQEDDSQPLIASPQGLLQVSIDQRPAKQYFDRWASRKSETSIQPCQCAYGTRVVNASCQSATHCLQDSYMLVLRTKSGHAWQDLSSVSKFTIYWHPSLRAYLPAAVHAVLT